MDNVHNHITKTTVTFQTSFLVRSFNDDILKEAFSIFQLSPDLRAEISTLTPKF